MPHDLKVYICPDCGEQVELTTGAWIDGRLVRGHFHGAKFFRAVPVQVFTAEEVESAKCAECSMALGSTHLFRCSLEGDVDLAAAFPTTKETR